MTRLCIRITSETAIFILKDLIGTYQDVGEKYTKVRTYLMYLIFLVKARENGWKSVDKSLTITAVLVAPANLEDRKRGNMFHCKVGYYREGVNKVNAFSFPVDSHWAKILHDNYVALSVRLEEFPTGNVHLRVAEDIESLVDIQAMVDRNYGEDE